MRRSACLLALVGLLAAVPAGLQAQDRRLAERLDPVSANSVQHLVDSARASSLPTEPLVQKALEGSTMGASGDRIRPGDRIRVINVPASARNENEQAWVR